MPTVFLLPGPDAIDRHLEELKAWYNGYLFGGEPLKGTPIYNPFGPSTLERVYQAFILGLLVSLEPRYEVSSNREARYGRYDILIRPSSAAWAGNGRTPSSA